MADYTGADLVVAQRFLNEKFAAPEKRLNTNIENRVSVETVVGEVTLDHHND